MTSYLEFGNQVKENLKTIEINTKENPPSFCKSCQKQTYHKVEYRQIRSADEGISVIKTCLICGTGSKKNT